MQQDDSEQQWMEEISSLQIEDILALCYAFGQSKERLILYLDVLRGRGGLKAQLASSLICFDLARQGMDIFQREFQVLAPTMIELGQNKDLIYSLIGENEYLNFIWDLCEAHLEEIEHPTSSDDVFAAEGDEIVIDLFNDEDFVDFELEVSDESMLQNFQWSLGEFLGYDPDFDSFDVHCGFRFHGKRDSARIEKFLLDLDSLRDYIPKARGLRAVVLLFYSCHQRSKDFWGRLNTRKASMISEAVKLFMENPEQVWDYITMLTGPLADDENWTSVSNLLVHFVRWCYHHQIDWRTNIDDYDPFEDLGTLKDTG